MHVFTRPNLACSNPPDMRRHVEHWLLQHWYSNTSPPWYLRLFEPMYLAFYRYAHRHDKTAAGRHPPGVVLIVVGNITAGGSGKTPLVIALCKIAADLGLRAGIASTGYGRKSRETLVVTTQSDAYQCGDEPVLLAQRTKVPVVVAASRLEAINELNQMQLDLIISDDGLQQAGLQCHMDICVVDGARGIGNGHLLPAGPLREPAERLYKVNHVVSNGYWPEKPADLDISVMQLQAIVVHSLDETQTCSLDDFRTRVMHQKLHAVAAIGNPMRFFNMLEEHGFSIIKHRYADHHRFGPGDFNFMDSKTTIIMTEKDAVKCRDLGLENAWYMPVDAQLPEDFEQAFKRQVMHLLMDKQ